MCFVGGAFDIFSVSFSITKIADLLLVRRDFHYFMHFVLVLQTKTFISIAYLLKIRNFSEMEKMLFPVLLWICTGSVVSIEEFPKWGIPQNDNKIRDILSKIADETFHNDLAKNSELFGEARPPPNNADVILLIGSLMEKRPMTLCGILWNTRDDDSLNECVAFLMKLRNEMVVSKEQKRQSSYKFNSSGWRRKKRDTHSDDAGSNNLSREEIMNVIQQILKVKKRRKFQASGW